MVKAQDLLDAGYSINEVREIEAGLKSGVDVSAYMDKKFHSIQMRQIRIGLEQELDVSKYANPMFDWLQMEEIREGLQTGLDVSVYAKPEIPHEKMRQLRLGLAEGINLISYLKYSAGVMRQLRMARRDKVNILKYVDEGYDDEQLGEILIALVNHIDLSGFLSKEYAAPSIAEIRKGLEIGIDVSIYANVEYSWFQMREIRLGLEHRIDVEKYASPFFAWEQMREIRLGLEEGLNVSNYAKLRFPSKEMRRRHMLLRKELHLDEIECVLNGETTEIVSGAASPSEEKTTNVDKMYLSVEQNGMAAYLTITEKRKVDKQDILVLLEENKIVAGVHESAISQIVAGHYSPNIGVLIATGQIPHKGDDGWYEFLFRTDVKKTPKVLADGSVDFKNVEWFETVMEGQVIAIYHEALEGVDGFNIFGVSVPARKGIEQRFLTGTGFILDDDKKTYRAEYTGMVTVSDLRLDVSRHLEVENVNFVTGNLTFDGSIHVLGNVENGMKISATEDVVVDGSVESAEIISGGSIVIKQGMNAAGHGHLKAAKSINGKFFEAVKVEAGEDIRASSFLNCELTAGGKIEAALTLAGGVSNALNSINVYNVGNKAGLKTVLKLGSDDAARKERLRIRDKQVEVQGEISILKNAYEEIREKYPLEVRNTMELYLKVENALYTKERELTELIESEAELRKKFRQEENARLIIKGQAFEGTILHIGRIRWLANNQYNVVVRKGNSDIEVVPNY